MALALAILLAVGPVIDFEPDGARVEVLLADLSGKLKRKLTCTKEVRDDVLVVSARRANTDQLLERMASALEATWQKEPDRWTLDRTAAQRMSRLDRDAKETIEWVKRSWDSSKPVFPPALTRAQAVQIAKEMMAVEAGNPRPNGFEARLPHVRAKDLLQRSVPPATISNVPLGERTVFSSHPNRMQRPFPATVQPIIDELNDQLGMLERALASQPRWESQSANLWPFYWADRRGNKIAKALVAVYRDGQSVTLEAKLLDSRGVEFPHNQGGQGQLTRIDLHVVPNVTLPSTEIRLGQESSEWVRLGSNAYGVFDFNGSSLPKLVRNASRRDPLSLVFTEGVRSLSRAWNAPVILAPVDGSMWDLHVSSRLGKFTVRSFEQTLRMGGMAMRNMGGWMVSVQPRPASIPFERTDRKATEEFAARHDREGRATLESCSALIARQPPGSWYLLARLVARVGPGIGISSQSEPLLRLYAAANAAERRALLSGRTLRAGELATAARHVLNKEVYGRLWNREIMAFIARTEDGSATPGYRDDITEMLPSGVPNNLPIKLTFDDGNEFWTKRADGLTTSQAANGIAGTLYEARQQGTENKLRFRPVARREYDLQIQLGSTFSRHILFNEFQPTAQGWLAFSGLPAEVRANVEELARQRRDEGKGGKPPP